MKLNKEKYAPYFFGMGGLVFMITLYYGLLWIITKDPNHPLFFFNEKWYLLLPLFIGFSVQMFLFGRLRMLIQSNQLKMAGTSAGFSGVAMAACCAHHVADFIPFIGLAGIAGPITKYQDVWLSLGALINAIGVIHMAARIQKQRAMSCVTPNNQIIHNNNNL